MLLGCAFEGCWDFECCEVFVEELKVPGILKLHINFYHYGKNCCERRLNISYESYLCVIFNSYPCFPNNLEAIFLLSSFSTSSEVSLFSSPVETAIVETNPVLPFRPWLCADFSSEDAVINNCPASLPFVDISGVLLLS